MSHFRHSAVCVCREATITQYDCMGCVFEKHAAYTEPITFCVCRTPTVTQYYCDVCGVFATSEEQLVMHNEGKKHKHTVALKELTEGHLPSGSLDAGAAQPGALPYSCKIGDCRGQGGGIGAHRNGGQTEAHIKIGVGKEAAKRGTKIVDGCM